MKYGAAIVSIGILFSIMGLLFFDDKVILKYCFLIVGLLMAMVGVFRKRSENSKK